MGEKPKQCPFLIFDGDVPKCKVKHQTGGIEHGYLPLPASDISKCTELFEKCPTYRGANKKACINCGTTFLKDEGGLIYIDDKPVITCPECGSSGIDRQMETSPDVTVEAEEVVDVEEVVEEEEVGEEDE